MADGSELKDEFAVLVQHVQRFFVEDCRPWAEFFGPVSQPKWTQAEVKKRVTTNVTFFATNYLLICALCSAFYIIRSPGLLVTLMLSLSMFVYVFMSRRKPLVVFDVSLGTREKMIGALAASTLLLSVTGYIFSLQYSVIFGSTLCLLHATFRPPVARAVRNSRSFEPEVHGGDGDVEGGVGSGSGGSIGRGRVNANIRLRTRPPVGGSMGMAMSPGLGVGGPGVFNDNISPAGDMGNPRLHSHAT